MTPSIVVFDIGGVLVEWEPHLAWMEELGTRDAVEAYMQRIDFMGLNKRGDAGEDFADLAAGISDPDDRRRLEAYVSLYARTVPNAVAGTWALVDRLIEREVPLHGITNWSAETWPEGLKIHPRLDEIFGTLVVSGRERVSKPEARIYQLLCERASVEPGDCVFIDDGMHNVEGARSIGMDGIHFTGAESLEAELVARGLL